MSSKPRSARFIEVYDALPSDAQRALLEKHLIPLLEKVPKDTSKSVTNAAHLSQKRYAGMPRLDLKAKRVEIQGMLDELSRDSKRSFVKERTNKDELVEEVIASLIDWLNDIWIVVYEFKVNYELAHSCLLYIADVLEGLVDARGGCKCAYTNQFISFTIKSKVGKTIKTFNLNGAQKIDRILLWIWRDLFVSLLASDNQRQKDLMPEMLEEIEHVKGWEALERILYGGKHESNGMDDDQTEDSDIDDEFDDDKSEEDDDEDESEEECWSDEASDISDSLESCGKSHYLCNFHARHWSAQINTQRHTLRQLVQERLMSRFEIMPSLLLHGSLMAITSEPEITDMTLKDVVDKVATSSSDTFAAALEIHSDMGDEEAIAEYLKNHYHLLRPRDAPILQTAAAILSENPFHHTQSLRILEKELMDTVRNIRAAILPLFIHADEDLHKQEIVQIAKLRHGSAQRQDRIERWVDSVITPGSNAPHPMAFAAMMFGLPIAPVLSDADDADPMGYLDEADPDLDDLREELRPKMRERFDGWAEVASVMKGGSPVLLKVYSQIVSMMPFFRVSDAVEEMIARLAEKPSKHHICDALDTVSSFCKLQKKKMVIKADKKKKAAAAAAAQQSASTSRMYTHTGAQPPPTIPQGIGGMEDVD